MPEEKIKLTSLTAGGGCGCKIPPGELGDILQSVRSESEFGLLIGNSTSDDAAVWDMGDGHCIVSTTDFFTPIVDNPYDFGRIAAANSISDIYAMGGKPVMAVSILGWPTDSIPVAIAGEVLKGAKEICSEAGIAIGGGHSIKNPEPIFGLAVTGIVRKDHIKRNTGAQAGDLLILTKPLGSGILTTAMKRGKLSKDQTEELTAQLVKLNRIGQVLGDKEYVHAMTDVTGFGLIGHLIEMLGESQLTGEIENNSVPLLSGVREFAEQFVYPDNTMRNWKNYSSKVAGVSGTSLLTLCDPQTNGGLLLAVDPQKLKEFRSLMETNSQEFYLIGRVESHSGAVVSIL